MKCSKETDFESSLKKPTKKNQKLWQQKTENSAPPPPPPIEWTETIMNLSNKLLDQQKLTRSKREIYSNYFEMIKCANKLVFVNLLFKFYMFRGAKKCAAFDNYSWNYIL